MNRRIEEDKNYEAAMDILRTFMECQALIAANSTWLAFKLGQVGTISDDPDRCFAMIESAEQDVRDLRIAAENLADVCFKMLETAKMNLAVIVAEGTDR